MEDLKDFDADAARALRDAPLPGPTLEEILTAIHAAAAQRQSYICCDRPSIEIMEELRRLKYHVHRELGGYISVSW